MSLRLLGLTTSTDFSALVVQHLQFSVVTTTRFDIAVWSQRRFWNSVLVRIQAQQYYTWIDINAPVKEGVTESTTIFQF